MIELYRPTIDELGFRESLMADEKTMSYNRAWGGTIPFPKTKELLKNFLSGWSTGILFNQMTPAKKIQ